MIDDVIEENVSRTATSGRVAFPSDLFEAEIRRLAAENPKYQHDKPCEYVDLNHGTGCCLLGQALENIGIDLEPFVASHSLNGEEFDDVVPVLGWDVDEKVLEWATTVQEHQDYGIEWAKAVALADGREID